MHAGKRIGRRIRSSVGKVRLGRTVRRGLEGQAGLSDVGHGGGTTHGQLGMVWI